MREPQLYFQTMDFGKPELSKTECAFYQRFSKEILLLCRSLPASAQTDAILFLMQYSGINLGDELDIFAHFHPPVWSILYWLRHHSTPLAKRLKPRDIENAITAQSMAMFLHSLDDHLTDNQISVSHLTLLLRSQAWMIMNCAFRSLAEGVPGGKRTVRRFMDEYFSSTRDSERPKSFDGYCDLFRGQMALGMIAPVLLSVKVAARPDFTQNIEKAFGSFGIAWRLLDDLRDIEDDIQKGLHSSLYYCLPGKIRAFWNPPATGNRAGAKHPLNAIIRHILEHNLIEKLLRRICTELETAASIAEAYDLTGLAREFRSLAHPLRWNGSA